MICESCGSTYDDNLTVCPVCGVSASQSFAEPDLQSVTQTVPPFVRKPGTEPDANEDRPRRFRTPCRAHAGAVERRRAAYDLGV